jgi:hypothetical protein
MSINLLKKTLVNQDQSDDSDSSETLPQKRPRSKELLKALISQDIDKRVLRKSKVRKTKSSKLGSSTMSLMDKVSKKLVKKPKNLEEKLEVLKSRSLPQKYIELLSKSKS